MNFPVPEKTISSPIEVTTATPSPQLSAAINNSFSSGKITKFRVTFSTGRFLFLDEF